MFFEKIYVIMIIVNIQHIFDEKRTDIRERV